MCHSMKSISKPTLFYSIYFISAYRSKIWSFNNEAYDDLTIF